MTNVPATMPHGSHRGGPPRTASPFAQPHKRYDRPHRSRDGGFQGSEPGVERCAGPHRSRDCGFLGHELSEGLPVPREPAYAAKRSQDGEAPAASE